MTDMQASKFVVLPDGINAKGDVFLRLMPIGLAAGVDNERHFKRDKTNKRLSVAGVYLIEHNETSYRLLGAKWVETFKAHAAVIEWETQQKAFDLEREAEAREKRETDKTLRLQQQLEPLRVAYQTIPYPQRLGFELWVLSVIRRKG